MGLIHGAHSSFPFQGGEEYRAFSLTPDFEVFQGAPTAFYYNTRGRGGDHGLGVFIRGKKRIWLDKVTAY